MPSSAQARFDETLSRIDSLLDGQVARLERVEAQQAAEREEARRARMRDALHERTAIASRYDSAFRSFGTTVPEPADDEAPSRYRARLFNRLTRRLSPDHDLAGVRADDLGGQPIVLDRFEEMIIAAAKAEGERPSIDNLPTDGAMVARTRTDADTGGKVTEWFGRRSFIADMTRPGRKVLRLVDPGSGRVLVGAPFNSR
jgi:hypothetical protein